MKEGMEILKHNRRHTGMTVPDGFFADFASKMAAELPQTEYETSVYNLPQKRRTMWQRVRPYVYMAAMFAGIWCMLKMFTIMTGGAAGGLDTNPTMAEALGNEVFVNEYIMDDIDQWDIIDDLYEEGVAVDSLGLDFAGYENAADTITIE